jgi:hypothetical protein
MTSKIKEEILKGCGIEVKEYTKYKWYAKKFITKICGKDNYLCCECQAKLDGYELAKKEILN